MAEQVIIQGSTYNLPVQGDSPPWGTDLTDLLNALIAVSNPSIGPADITTTSFTIANNVASPTNVSGAAFNTAIVRSAILSYSIYISTSINELCETGQIYLSYKSTAGSWELAQNYSGSSGVIFSITSSGQLTYTSSNISGTSYVGKMKFNARAFLQA